MWNKSNVANYLQKTQTHWFLTKTRMFSKKNFIYYERIRDMVSKKLSHYEYWKNSSNILSFWSIYRLPSKPPVVSNDNEIAFKPEGRFLGIYITENLTPCCQAMQECVIAIPCIVDGSHISTFSYTTSCTCVCQLAWLTFHFKVIDSLMQDAWVSSYK